MVPSSQAPLPEHHVPLRSILAIRLFTDEVRQHVAWGLAIGAVHLYRTCEAGFAGGFTNHDREYAPSRFPSSGEVGGDDGLEGHAARHEMMTIKMPVQRI